MPTNNVKVNMSRLADLLAPQCYYTRPEVYPFQHLRVVKGFSKENVKLVKSQATKYADCPQLHLTLYEVKMWLTVPTTVEETSQVGKNK